MKRYPFVLASLALGVCLSAGAAAHAQNEGAGDPPSNIPVGIITATRELSDDELKVIYRYVDFWVNAMINGKDDEVPKAREHLVEPLVRAGQANRIFRAAYIVAVSKRLIPATKSPRLIVIVNTMLVVKEVADPQVLDVLKAGLSHKSTAGRYAAAQATAALVDREETDLSAAQATNLQSSLIDALKAEKSGWVLEDLYRSLIALARSGDLSGLDAVLDKMDERVQFHGMHPQAPIGTELTGFRGTFFKLLTLSVTGKINNATLVKLAKVACRYMDFCATVQLQGIAPQNQLAELGQMITQCDGALTWDAVHPLAPEVKWPASIKDKGIQQILITVQDYKIILVGEPFKFKMEDLAVPFKRPAPEPE